MAYDRLIYVDDMTSRYVCFVAERKYAIESPECEYNTKAADVAVVLSGPLKTFCDEYFV